MKNLFDQKKETNANVVKQKIQTEIVMGRMPIRELCSNQ